MSLSTLLHRTLPLLLLPLFLLAGPTAQAQIQIDLQPLGMNVPVGTAATQTFTAQIVNQYTQNVYITGSFATSDSPLSIDDTAFQNYFFPLDGSGNYLPLVPLTAGEILNVPLFDASMPASAGLGTYNGVYDIIYGFDPTDTGSDVAAGFVATVSVSGPGAVPEPGALPLCIGLIVSIGILLKRRKRSLRPL